MNKYVLSALMIVALVLPGLVHAETTIGLQLDRTRATTADAIRMVVSVEGTRQNTQAPMILGLDDFRISSGGTSRHIEIVNGKKSSKLEYSYYVQPKTTGTFTIGPARIKIDGRICESNTVSLIVGEPEQSANDRGALFLEAALSDETAYSEQQVTYTLKLYRRVKASDVSVELPEDERLSFRQLGDAVEYRSMVSGQPYQVLEVSYILVAASPGKYALAPARMGMNVYDRQRTSGSPFGDPFFGFSSGRPANVASQPLELTVLPLPQQGRPADFSGLVGTFTMDSSLEPVRIKAGESASLSVIIRGHGNVNRIPDLELPVLDGIKVYADQPQLTSSIDRQGIAGTKTMKWALVPRKDGSFVVPGMNLSFFNPETRRYESLGTQPYELTVLPGEQASKEILPVREDRAATGKHEVEELGRDILPVHTSMQAFDPGLNILQHMAVSVIFLFVPPLVYLAVFFTQHLKKKSIEQGQAIRARKASRVFTSCLRKDDPTAAQTLDAIRYFMNDRLGLSLGLITPDEAADIALSHGAHDETATRLRDAIKMLQEAVYSGAATKPADSGHDLVGLIRRIDREVG